MWLVNLFKAFFETWTSTNKVIEKSLPSEKIQEAKFDIKSPTLDAKELSKRIKERNDRVDEMFHDLVHHPEINPETKVRQEMFGADEAEIFLTVEILTQRLEANEGYQKRKAKKGKFRL